jgi:hypothetical protein
MTGELFQMAGPLSADGPLAGQNQRPDFNVDFDLAGSILNFNMFG